VAVKTDGGRAPQDHLAEGADYQPHGQKPTTQHEQVGLPPWVVPIFGAACVDLCHRLCPPAAARDVALHTQNRSTFSEIRVVEPTFIDY